MQLNRSDCTVPYYLLLKLLLFNEPETISTPTADASLSSKSSVDAKLPTDQQISPHSCASASQHHPGIDNTSHTVLSRFLPTRGATLIISRCCYHEEVVGLQVWRTNPKTTSAVSLTALGTSVMVPPSRGRSTGSESGAPQTPRRPLPSKENGHPTPVVRNSGCLQDNSAAGVREGLKEELGGRTKELPFEDFMARFVTLEGAACTYDWSST